MFNSLEGKNLANFLNLPNPEEYEEVNQELLNEIEFAKTKENSKMKLEDWQKFGYGNNEGIIFKFKLLNKLFLIL